MDFKRHSHSNQNQVAPFNFGSRNNNSGNASYGGHGHGGYPSFGNHHSRPPQQHNVRGYKTDMHGGRLNLMPSFRNLMKLHGDNITDRESAFLTIFQYRECLLSRISSMVSSFLSDEVLDDLFGVNDTKLLALLPPPPPGNGDGNEQALACLATTTEADQAHALKKTTEKIENVMKKLKAHRRETINHLMEEVRLCHVKEQAFVDGWSSRERRLEKDLMDFFNEAERQMMDYEKQVRSDNYPQLLGRLRNADREIAIRDQKILQLEDTVKMLSDRSEKVMAELQQVNADHQFEKLQLYHHVEVCKVNAKCLAMDELTRLFNWKMCACGRKYDTEILREVENHFNNNGFGSSYQPEPFGRCMPPNAPERKEAPVPTGVPGFWSLPLPTSSSSTSLQTLLHQQMQPPPTCVPNGSFIPAEEAASKGAVVNDMRDRYDELQLKAAGIPNYEDVRTMIMKIVCHFKHGDFRVMEEMGGKKFVSTLFYSDPDDLVPTPKDKNIFATGYGDTPEEATAKSVKRAYDEIQRIDHLNSSADQDDIAFVRRDPKKSSKKACIGDGPIRMTMLRSYCGGNLDKMPEDKNKSCLQEAYLYVTSDGETKEESYMVDWQTHIRVEAESLDEVREKLKRIYTLIKEKHVDAIIDPPLKDNKKKQKAKKECK